MSSTNSYEAIFILHPATPEDEQANLLEKIKHYAVAGGGEVTSVNSSAPWGRRRLAYTIKKVNEGYYSLMNVNLAAASLPEFERNLKLMEPLLRYTIVRL